jgi:hypothetical protein
MDAHWDPMDVWRRLRRDHPVQIDNPASSTGRMDRRNAKVFWASIAEYPDPLQDAMFVIAHARGFEAAIAALDQAIRGHLADHRRNFQAAPLWNGERTHATERDIGLRRAAS